MSLTRLRQISLTHNKYEKNIVKVVEILFCVSKLEASLFMA